MNYYSSSIILFIGTEENLSFPPTQLVVWDDSKKFKLGLIILKQKIIDIRTTKNVLYLMVAHKILLYEMVTLNYICTLEDVDFNIHKVSVSLIPNPTAIAYGSWSNTSVIKINKCIVYI